MSQPHELYRYAAPGERQLKSHHGSSQQQVRYLPGVEIRTSAQQQLRVITTGNSHIYLTGSQNMAHFNLADRLGSLSAVVDEQGAFVSRETWYPFGGTASWLTGAQAGAALKFQRYVGKERDASGLIFFGWRYLVPWEMRWLNCDPAGTIDGLNLFCMVGNNPLTLRDRDGRMKSDDKALDLSTAPLPPNKRWLKRALRSETAALQPEVIPSTRANTQPLGAAISVLTVQDPPQPGPSYVPEPGASEVVTGRVCPTCNRSFKTAYLLEKHIRMENNDPLICDVCGKDYYHKYDLTRHKLIHSNEKPHVCKYPNCEKRFKTTSERAAHVKRAHNTDETYDCKLCDKTFTSKAKLQDHKWGIHTNKKRFYCELCPLSFKKLPQLEAHKTSGVHQLNKTR